MSVVYLARDRASGRTVAIKLLGAAQATASGAARRFAREARMVAILDHPRIVRTLAIEEIDEGAVAIVSEYIDGRTLRDLLRSSGALAFDHATTLLRDIASALAHAHRYRIVHRDVKPENVFVQASSGSALLADFGIARQLDADTQVTTEGSALGTPAYMAPEQVAGSTVDERADVYALGLIGWEMLTGYRPWGGETLYSVLHKQQHERLPSLADLRPDTPAYLLIAIERALEKSPERRWRNGAEFLERLTMKPVALPTRGSTALVRATDYAPTMQLPARHGVPHIVAMEILPMRQVRWRWVAAATAAAIAMLSVLPRSNPTASQPVAAVAVPPPRLVARTVFAPRPAVIAPRASVVESRGGDVAVARRMNIVRSSADAGMNGAMQALVRQVRRHAGRVRNPPALRALLAEQRSWLRHRAQSCGRRIGAQRDSCYRRLTRLREGVLRGRLDLPN